MAVGSDVKMWATAISTNVLNGRKIQPLVGNLAVGQPVAEDHERMNALEDALESVLKEEGFATLALVSTGENLREWTYYAKSEAEFMSRLNYAFGGTPAFPIEIHTARDPNWEMYEEFKAGIKEIADR